MSRKIAPSITLVSGSSIRRLSILVRRVTG